MQHSPSWETNSTSASREITRILWKPEVHYRIHKTPPLPPTLRQIKPVSMRPSYFLELHFDIICPCTPRSSNLSLSLMFPHQNLAWTSLLALSCHMPSPFHSSRFDHPNKIDSSKDNCLFTGAAVETHCEVNYSCKIRNTHTCSGNVRQ
jgi:hypothetical protein